MDTNIERVPARIELHIVRYERTVLNKVLTVAILLLVAYDRADVYGAKHADTSRTLLSRDGMLPVRGSKSQAKAS